MKVNAPNLKKRKYGLLVRGGNTHQKLAFTTTATNAEEALKGFTRYYKYKLGVDPNKMETFFVVPIIDDQLDFYSTDSNGWDINDTFYPACNKK